MPSYVGLFFSSLSFLLFFLLCNLVIKTCFSDLFLCVWSIGQFGFSFSLLSCQSNSWSTCYWFHDSQEEMNLKTFKEWNQIPLTFFSHHLNSWMPSGFAFWCRDMMDGIVHLCINLLLNICEKHSFTWCRLLLVKMKRGQLYCKFDLRL